MAGPPRGPQYFGPCQRSKCRASMLLWVLLYIHSGFLNANIPQMRPQKKTTVTEISSLYSIVSILQIKQSVHKKSSPITPRMRCPHSQQRRAQIIIRTSQSIPQKVLRRGVARGLLKGEFFRSAPLRVSRPVRGVECDSARIHGWGWGDGKVFLRRRHPPSPSGIGRRRGGPFRYPPTHQPHSLLIRKTLPQPVARHNEEIPSLYFRAGHLGLGCKVRGSN